MTSETRSTSLLDEALNFARGTAPAHPDAIPVSSTILTDEKTIDERIKELEAERYPAGIAPDLEPIIREELREIAETEGFETPKDPTSEKAIEYHESRLALTKARSTLAEKQVGFRHRFGFNSKARRQELEDAKQTYNTAVMDTIKARFAVIRDENPTITSEEINRLAISAYQQEFSSLTREQANPEYIKDKWGKAFRKLGGLSLGKKIAVGVGMAAAGTATLAVGGVAGVVGVAGTAGYRVAKSLARGVAAGHNKKEGSERIIKKVTAKTNSRALEELQVSSLTASDELASIIGRHISSTVERIDQSDRRRRKIAAGTTVVAAVFGARALHGAISSRDFFFGLKPGADELAGSEKPSSSSLFDEYANNTDPTVNTEEGQLSGSLFDEYANNTDPTVNEDVTVPEPTTTAPTTTPITEPDTEGTPMPESTEPETPVAEPPAPVEEEPPVDVPVEPIPEAPAPTAVLPTEAEFHSLNEFLFAPGEHAWTRAVYVFDGDQAAALEWIKNSAEAAGATWHNEGTPNAWLEINGRSDTDYVWQRLVEASLTTLPPAV